MLPGPVRVQTGPAGQIVEGRAERPGAQLPRGSRGQPPLRGALIPIPDLGQRLGEPPAAAH
ncbi:MAG: hypothetical protein ACR2MP_13515 [Streptosporangiaceae bacterium]